MESESKIRKIRVIYKTELILFNEIGPSRRIFTSFDEQSITVDGTPPGDVPPSIISGMRPLSCSSTSWAVDGLGCPDIFAEVTAIGPAKRKRMRATA